MSAIISVKNLSKNYCVKEHKRGMWQGVASLFSNKHRIVSALNSISFEINEGELIGYIGPNGAGKSTTIKILSGILFPSEGEVKIMGKIPWKKRIETVKQIGVVFGQRSQLWWDLPVIESYDLIQII